MLPGLDGVTLCRAIRRDSRNTDAPILMLTARRDEVDKVLGLDSGADDYLTKPFGVRELVARVALLRRRRPLPASTRRPCRPGTFWLSRRAPGSSATARSSLTAHEFELLYVLAGNRGIVFSRDALVQRVWGEDTHITVRSVDTLVKRLRRKLEKDPADPHHPDRGPWYKFADA